MMSLVSRFQTVEKKMLFYHDISKEQLYQDMLKSGEVF